MTTTSRATAAASTEERLRTTPFDACTPAELEQLRALMDDLALDPPQRRSRRHRRAVRGQAIDLRQSLRAARHTGGDPLRLVRRRRRTRQRRVVLIADVSGSMEAYGRAYLYLLHGAVRALRAEAFVFATRLHRLTRQLRTTQPAVALAAAMAATPDWSGGTRLGDAIKAFNDGWARRGLARGAVVVIVSDGWEGGDPAVLGREMERLARLAHRIVWVNPRLQSPQFRPLTGGMAAALPHVDDVVSGHDLDELEHVLEAIRAPRGRSVRGRGIVGERAHDRGLTTVLVGLGDPVPDCPGCCGEHSDPCRARSPSWWAAATTAQVTPSSSAARSRRTAPRCSRHRRPSTTSTITSTSTGTSARSRRWPSSRTGRP